MKNTWQILELATPLPAAPTTLSKPSGEGMPGEDAFFNDPRTTAEDIKRYLLQKHGNGG